MKKLTDNQKEFLLNYFFRNGKYAGWKHIATALLEDGSCIVPGPDCIWIGEIGNFIKTSVASNAIDCLLYEFDLKYFLSSEYYKSISNQYIDILATKKREIDEEFNDICNL